MILLWDLERRLTYDKKKSQNIWNSVSQFNNNQSPLWEAVSETGEIEATSLKHIENYLTKEIECSSATAVGFFWLGVRWGKNI